jgi:hypothetical protein
MGRRIVKIFNTLTRMRRARCKPERLLLLLPSCLQRSECDQKVRNDVADCLRCGRCKIKDMVEMAEKYGCQCAVVTGGRLALRLAKGEGVDAIVAVACEKELQLGLKAALPKPALGVINVRPNGPCKDTDVAVAEVEEAIRWLLRAEEPVQDAASRVEAAEEAQETA